MAENYNIFKNIPKKLDEEFFEDLYSDKEIKIERIVSYGQITPENATYDQNWNEWVILLSGYAKILFTESDKQFELYPGDWLFIKAHCKHRVIYTAKDQQSVWLAVHFA